MLAAQTITRTYILPRSKERQVPTLLNFTLQRYTWMGNAQLKVSSGGLRTRERTTTLLLSLEPGFATNVRQTKTWMGCRDRKCLL